MYAIVNRIDKKIVGLAPVSNYWDAREGVPWTKRVIRMTVQNSPQTLGDVWINHKKAKD